MSGEKIARRSSSSGRYGLLGDDADVAEDMEKEWNISAAETYASVKQTMHEVVDLYELRSKVSYLAKYSESEAFSEKKLLTSPPKPSPAIPKLLFRSHLEKTSNSTCIADLLEMCVIYLLYIKSMIMLS